MCNEKKYCFTDQEFGILAAWAGITDLYGFLGNGEEMMDEKTVHVLLFGMVKKSFLYSGTEGYILQSEIKKLFEQIREANSVVVCTSKNNLPTQCIYFAEKAVIVEEDGLNDRMVKLRSAELQDAIHEVLETIQPDEPWETEEDDCREQLGTVCCLEADPESFPDVVMDKKDMENFLKKADILVKLECWNKRKKKITWRIWMVSLPLYDILLCQHDGITERYPYSIKKLEELMGKMTGLYRKSNPTLDEVCLQ